MRLLTPIYALSLLGVTLADCGVEGGTIIVANPNYQILNELEACSTIFGDILVDPGFVYFILNGPLDITGTLIAHENNILKTVTLNNVTHLGGFSFASPHITGRVYLPEVTAIGYLEWRNITWRYEEDYFEWKADKLVAVSSLNVEATHLSGFSPDYESYDGGFYYSGLPQLETADNIRVVDNQRMDNVVFEGLKTISSSLIVGNNFNQYHPAGKRDVESRLISFPALESAGSVVIYDKESSLSRLGGKIDLPALGHVFGDFNVTDTEGITEISVPALTDIDGGLNILGGKELKDLNFPELRRVDHVFLDGGDSYFGGFREIKFPVLEEVGAFHVYSRGYVFDCSSLDHIREIASDFSCSNSLGGSTPSSTSEAPTPTPSSPVSSPTSEPSPSNEPSSSHEPPSDTPVPSSVSEPSLTSIRTTDEPGATSGPVPTDQPDQTNSPTATNSPESTGSSGGSEGPSPTTTGEDSADASASTPATSGAGRLHSPFRVVFMLLMGRLL